MIKNILCFGDSNTWGLDPSTGKRFDENTRWTARLAKKLGPDFNVIEAGQPNRTLINLPPFDGVLCGVRYLKPYLEQYSLDVIIIALGTNDLKKRFNLTPKQISQGLDCLIRKVTCFYDINKQPKILILSPAYIKTVGPYKHIYQGAECKNEAMSEQFKNVAFKNDALFFDLQSVVNVSPLDGIHMSTDGHYKIADAVFKITRAC
ncbi:SGNH/GDSL hydrolase family protein [Pseudoalteromonas sp. SG45-5]|uniref:SGNH/GDSL hydrolase family protein n=1 Tax=unclassified Pseudoalteromonas TaxID=194690 RepID=UPI0015F91320|nr:MULTISPECIES: SGNH/GDSL hydrolase family protein [unclassified Pseudoalteromonas]MBB1384094.1 SGNH/GDSL hydrolase family protein [Pseudoalteromonas sp. SG45-5]MBB1392206.1 SGNH/GDSL hydrolase family protein [Pseudoalteromonas sp. SG44-4]MBB1448048.1 SGNH/GDSL hydrolase family protein [Pseudoalteromonas sp. SG41-6]